MLILLTVLWRYYDYTETLVRFLCGEDPLKRDRLPIPVFLGFPGASDSKESTCNAGDLDSIPGLGRSLWEGTAIYSSILAWRIPWAVQSMGLKRVRHNSKFHFHLTNEDIEAKNGWTTCQGHEGNRTLSLDPQNLAPGSENWPNIPYWPKIK